jgi:hypothetical protein
MPLFAWTMGPGVMHATLEGGSYGRLGAISN